MQFRITSVAPGEARLFFETVPGNALIEDLTACPAIWQLWQEASTTFLLWFVPSGCFSDPSMPEFRVNALPPPGVFPG